jgi:hypothetical protein
MRAKHKTRIAPVRVFALTLAVLFIVFVTHALAHSHARGQNEASCHVCQAAHLSSAATAGTPSLVTPFLAVEDVQPFIVTIHEELFFHDSLSRAPPAK